MRYILFFWLAWLVAVFPSAQTLNLEDGVMRWEANMDCGLNTDGCQFDMGATYFPIQYVGLKAAIGFSGELKPLTDSWEDNYLGYYDDDDYPSRFKFTTSLVLRTPRLITWKSQNAGFYLFAEPGFILSPGASGSHNASWSNWDLRTGINLQLDRLIVFLGYGVTDFYLYSGMPPYEADSAPKRNHITHSGFLGTAFKF